MTLRQASILVVLSAGAIACASGPRTYSRPAPAAALPCALRVATDSGFTPQRGGVADGYIVFQRPRGWTKGDVAGETTKRVLTLGIKGAGRTIADQLTVTGAGGQLRVTAASLDRDRKEIGPTDESTSAAGYVLSICAP